MSDTMASSSDWLQFYRRTITGEDLPPPPASSVMYGRDSDATIVTSVGPPATGNSTSMNTGTTHLNAEGRVSKPSRRRSRASRRAPTTLLNTDTTNFRAMVQQFTGVPSAPFTTGPQTGLTNFNFGVGSGQHHVNTATIMAPSGYHLQQQQQQQPQEQQQYMLSMNNSTSDAFLQRFSNSNLQQRSNMEVSVSDGFLMESIFHPRAS